MSSRHLRQLLTYWAPGGPDGSGGTLWGVPTRIYGRWEDRSEEVHNPTGELIVSRAVVFLDQEVLTDGYLYNGTSIDSNPALVLGAQRIAAFIETPNLRNMKTERRAYCK